MGGDSGSAPTQQNVTSTTTNLPAYAQPYFQNLLDRAQANSYTNYTPYQGQQVAGFNPAQQQVQDATMSMQTPGQFQGATQLAGAAGLGALQASQQPINAQQIGQPQLNNYSMSSPDQVQAGLYAAPQVSGPSNVSAQQNQAGQMGGPQQVQATQQYAGQMGAPQQVQGLMSLANQMQGPGNVQAGYSQGAQMGAAQTGYNPQLQNYMQNDPGTFGLAQAQQYMSPYAQQVADVQKQAAIRDAQKGQLAANLAAPTQGTYGGARQLLAATERERNLGDQLAQIQATSSQNAYTNAQQQYGADRAAGMQTATANQNAALGVQQLGANTGLQTSLANLSSAQQANVQNLAAQLQTQGLNAQQAMQAALANQQMGYNVGQANLGAAQQTQGLNAQQFLQSQLANQQAGLTTGQANLGAYQQTQAQNAQQALQSQLANQQAGLTTGQANLSAYQQTQGQNQQAALQAALANQQSGLTTNQQNLGSMLQTQGINAGQYMQAQTANQQANLATGQANLNAAQQTQQLGAQTGLQALMANQSSNLQAQQMQGQLGLQGLSQANTAAQTLSGIGTQQQAADLGLLNAQNAVGAQQQALQQQYDTTAYNNFLAQRDWQTSQLGYYSNILRGLPITPNTTTSASTPAPSALGQLAGAGLGAASLYKLAG